MVSRKRFGIKYNSTERDWRSTCAGSSVGSIGGSLAGHLGKPVETTGQTAWSGCVVHRWRTRHSHLRGSHLTIKLHSISALRLVEPSDVQSRALKLPDFLKPKPKLKISEKLKTNNPNEETLGLTGIFRNTKTFYQD